jgi:elongation factor Tu
MLRTILDARPRCPSSSRYFLGMASANPLVPHLNVGTLGHAGHGKTTLAAAITHAAGVRGVPMAVLDIEPPWPGYWLRMTNTLPYALDRWNVTHFDCPGIRGTLRAVARSVTALDVAIVVVDAVEGVGPQTRDHLLLARRAEVSDAFLFLNKCDKVADPAHLDLAEAEARELLDSCGYAGNEVAIVRGSAMRALAGDEAWTSPIEALVELVARSVRPPARDAEALAPRLRVHRAYRQFRAHGAALSIVEAFLERGTVAADESLHLFTRDGRVTPVRVIEVQRFRERVDRAYAGEYIALSFALDGFRRKTLRGALLADASTPPTAAFRATVDLMTPEQGGRHTPIPDGHYADAHMRGDRLRVRIALGDATWFPPGTSRENVRFELGAPVPIEVGASFALSDGSDGLQRLWGGPPRASGLIGGGVVTALG